MTEARPHPLEGILDILREAVWGGAPGQPTAFVENTRADGVAYGLLPTLGRLTPEQASREVLGTSVAGQARHAAFHLEVIVAWERDGKRGPFDWKGSFHPAQVDAGEWAELQARVRRAYDDLVAFARTRTDREPDGELASGLAGGVAHVAYHLGAIRQMVKAVQESAEAVKGRAEEVRRRR